MREQAAHLNVPLAFMWGAALLFGVLVLGATGAFLSNHLGLYGLPAIYHRPLPPIDALVGEWSCRSSDSSSTRERYSSDGSLFWQTEAKPNGDAAVDRAVTKLDGNYQLKENKLSFEMTRMRMEFAREDAGNAQSLAATGSFTSVGPREIETAMPGYGGSALISIEGNRMNFRITSFVHNGVEEGRDKSDVCSRVGR